MPSSKLARCFRCGERGHIVDDCSLDKNICFFCKESGHVQDECPRKTKLNAKKKPRLRSHRSRSKEKIRCFNCHERGHLSKACPLVEDICNFCKQTGHLKKDCVLKTRNDQHSAQREPKQHEESQRQQSTTTQGFAFAQEKDMRVQYPHNFHSGYLLQPPLGYQGFIPPLHVLWPLPGPALLHTEPFGPGIHPTPVPFPSDTLPPLEIMEQKLASQHWEMQRLTAENQRFATVHSSLKQELTDAQKELQRLQNQMDAVKTGKDQQLKLFLDKVAKMEADLKSSESAKVELQQAHAEAQSLAGARQELISQVQQMNQDLQRSRGDDQQILALMSELEVLRQEYQCCRETYDNERKLRIGHYEALQATEKNFDSMIRELEKLHAELSNAAIIDKSATATLGGQFGINADAYKENVASGKYHTRQIPYEDRYGKASFCCLLSWLLRGDIGDEIPHPNFPDLEQEHAGVAAPHPESAAGLVSAQAVYNASIVPRDIVLGITGNDGPQGIHASLASGYAARGVGVDLSATGMTAAARDSTQAPPSYGAAQQAAYVTGCDYKALCGGSNAPMHP
ncbi:hypothetical protein ZIOFF_003054 [Zingiber officinale]|uniref:CCHC-type domain-containing protein n=1 Tax=Zingiber officinale TaxID=94328 RepID=A0A8J5I607_ZINOF|nr:hypothetical protein ZIOFF_003054 [Zingiber officinale]